MTELTYNGNLLPQTETVRAGDNSASSTTTKGYDSVGNIIWVDGPMAGTGDRTYYFWDAASQPIGEIAADPDGAGPLPRPAIKRAFDNDGLVTSVKTGTATGTTLAALNAMTVNQEVVTTYDGAGRKVKEAVLGGTTIQALTQYSYNLAGRLECTVVRMGSASELASINSSNPAACTPSLRSNGYDRVTKNVYDAAGQVLQVIKAYGTADQATDATYTYSLNGLRTSVTDANGNKATMDYDGFDRQTKWTFPSKTTPGTANTADYEQYAYDANGNRTSLRKRDGQTIAYSFDALNRPTLENVPTGSDVYYGYDLQGHQLYARFGSATGAGITNSYDTFGRLLTTSSNQSGTAKTITHQYDADGNRTRVTHPDGTYFTYVYDDLDRLTSVKENGSTVIASMAYNAKSELQTLVRGAVTTTYGYDPISRPTSIADNLVGTASDRTATFAYNPASQIVTRTSSNDAYAFTGYVNVNRTYAHNGLNQYTTAGAATFGYDANGNLTSDGTLTYGYDVENRLTSAKQGTTTVAALVYDPLGRLYQTSGGSAGTTRFLYDGDELVEEYNTSGTVLRRFVHANGADDPLIWYEGATVSALTRRSLEDDHQGSIVSVADSSGNMVAINSYDEYGIPAAGNTGRFQYTGQAWIPELGMYYYKARIYSPSLGRFMQIDPVGYKDQINLYAYVGNDPVNNTDPSGNQSVPGTFSIETACQGDAGCIQGYRDAQVKLGKIALEAFSWIAPLAIPVVGEDIDGARIIGTVAKDGVEAGAEEATTTVRVSRSAHPEAAAHIERAQAAGKPRVLTVDRAGSAARRRAALKNTPRRPGTDRDEYPPAMFEEGGEGSSVENIKRSDNRGAGASVAHQCRNVPNGEKVTITVCD